MDFDDVIELIDEQLANGLYCECADPLHCECDDDMTKGEPECELCGGSWHGLERIGCPGAFASGEEIKEYKALRGVVSYDEFSHPKMLLIQDAARQLVLYGEFTIQAETGEEGVTLLNIVPLQPNSVTYDEPNT
jgi:hypothetical protein